MNRSALLSVLFVGLLFAQGGAYGLVQSGPAMPATTDAPADRGPVSVVDDASSDVGSSAAADSESDTGNESRDSSSDADSDSNGDADADTDTDPNSDGDADYESVSDSDDMESSDSTGSSDGTETSDTAATEEASASTAAENTDTDTDTDAESAGDSSDASTMDDSSSGTTAAADDSDSEGADGSDDESSSERTTAVTNEDGSDSKLTTTAESGSDSSGDGESSDAGSSEDAESDEATPTEDSGDASSDSNVDSASSAGDTSGDDDTPEDDGGSTEGGESSDDSGAEGTTTEATGGDSSANGDSGSADEPTTSNGSPPETTIADGDSEGDSSEIDASDSDEKGSSESEDAESNTETDGTSPQTPTGQAAAAGGTGGDDAGTPPAGDGGEANGTPSEEAPVGGLPDETTGDGAAPGGQAPSDDAATGDDAAAGGAGGATGGTPPADGQAPGGQAPAGGAPGGQAPGGQTPSGQTSGGSQVPAGGAPGGGASGGAATGGTAAGGAGGATASGGAAGGAAAGGAQGQQGGGAASSDADFEVVDSSLDASIGTGGTLTVELENDGEDAENAVVTLQSQDGGLTFGGSASASQFVGEWEEGETRTIEVDASVAPGADQRSYPVQATVSYENDDGEQVQSSPASFGVTPGDEQDFTLDDVDSSLSAGDRGTVSGTITNEGPADATDAVLVFAGNGSDVMPRQSQVVLGDLDDDESTDFTYPVAVRQGAPPGERQVPFIIQYQDEEGNTLQSERLNAQVEIDEAQRNFAVTDVDSELEPGETGIVEVTIENQGESVTDATVSLQSISPNIVFGQAANTSVFVGDWDNGDTKTVEVRATATQTATEGEYPVQASIAYTEEDNDQPPRAGPITFGVEIGDSDDDFTVTDVDSDLEPGGSGTVEVTLENDDEDLTDATVSLQTLSPAITFGQTANASVFVGDWDEGETRTVDVRANVAPDATEGEYPVQTSVSYTEADDNQRGQAGPFAFGVAVGGITDEFAVTSVDSDLEPGERGTVEVTLENTDTNVTDATINLQSLSPAILFGQTANTSRFVGDWNVSETRTVEVQATAARSATEGQYPLQTTVSYTDGDNRSGRAGPLAFGAAVGQSADDFVVTNVNSTVPIGDQGTVFVTLRNEEENATESTVSLRSLSADLSLGPAANATQFVGDWDEGERRTVAFEVTASNGSERRSYPFQTSVSYTDRGNQRTQDGPYTIGVTPLREQSFSLGNATSNLSVGEEGSVSTTVVNEGPQSIRNAVVRLTTSNRDVTVQQEEIAIGTLQAGESANVSFPIEVSDNAQPGVQQFSVIVEYDNQAGNPRESDALNTRIEIEPEEDPFGVGQSALQLQGQNASANGSGGEPLTPGGTKTVTVPVTNNRDVPLRNIEAQAFTDDPLSLANDQAFIAELGPGETANITFEVSASGSARPGTYPLSLDFQYETPDGDTRLTDTYKVSVQIEEAEGGVLSSLGGEGGLPIWLLILIVLLVAAVLGYVLYQRRDSGSGGSSGSAESSDSTSSTED